MSVDIRKEKEKNRCNAVEGKVVYVHSDNEEYHALYCNGKLISWSKGKTDIPVILQGLGLSYYDYQISDNVCEPGFDQMYWIPPHSLHYLHFINKAERKNEYKKQREIDDTVEEKDFERLKFVEQQKD